jgi:hypothetical protein
MLSDSKRRQPHNQAPQVLIEVYLEILGWVAHVVRVTIYEWAGVVGAGFFCNSRSWRWISLPSWAT